jgi:hypothetical protein
MGRPAGSRNVIQSLKPKKPKNVLRGITKQYQRVRDFEKQLEKSLNCQQKTQGEGT